MTMLWSLHDPSFDLVDRRVDHSKSCFYQTNQRIRDAYHRLWEIIDEPEGQLIWCYTERSFPKTGILKKLWSLEVEKEMIVCRIDDIAWNKIIGNEIALPPKFGSQWNRTPKSGDWWDELCVEEHKNGYLTSALIRHPISHGMVKSVVNWNSK